MIPKVVVVWFGLLLVAILNGTLREMLLAPRLGVDAGHFASTVTLCAAIALVTWIAIDWVGPATATEAWTVGVIWLGLTVAFEFLGGHYLFGNSGKGCWSTTTSSEVASGYSYF
jgi:hypothetical protein